MTKHAKYAYFKYLYIYMGYDFNKREYDVVYQ